MRQAQNTQNVITMIPSTLSLFALLIPGIAAQLGLYLMVPADRLETAMLNGQKPLPVDIDKEISGFHPLPREPACPQVLSAEKSEVKDCKTPYIYHSHIVFSNARTSPLLANITLSEEDTPQLVSVGV
jgi:hypothetical protein